jgi:hypothetical protein
MRRISSLCVSLLCSIQWRGEEAPLHRVSAGSEQVASVWIQVVTLKLNVTNTVLHNT